MFWLRYGQLPSSSLQSTTLIEEQRFAKPNQDTITPTSVLNMINLRGRNRQPISGDRDIYPYIREPTGMQIATCPGSRPFPLLQLCCSRNILILCLLRHHDTIPDSSTTWYQRGRMRLDSHLRPVLPLRDLQNWKRTTERIPLLGSYRSLPIAPSRRV